MLRSIKNRVTAVILLISLLIGSIVFDVSDVYADIEDMFDLGNAADLSWDEVPYQKYYQWHELDMIESYDSENFAEITLKGADYLTAESDILETDGDNLIIGSTGSVTYQFDVPTDAAYNIEIRYMPVGGTGATIARALYINGELPFQEADSLFFSRIWMDENKDFLTAEGNQASPRQVEAPDWLTKKLESGDGYYSQPFAFYFAKGQNTITLESISEPMLIDYIKLVRMEQLQPYQNYLRDRKSEGAIERTANSMGNPIMVLAQDTAWKSESSFMALNDRTSTKTMPYHPSNIVLNTIGGDVWSTPGESMTWNVNVKEAGLYRIALRFKQVSNRDFYSFRSLKINGEIPFSEASQLGFYYSSKFQLNYLGDEYEPYFFYLDEGVNTLTLTVVLGDLGNFIREVENSVDRLTALYREIVTITGTSPDRYRDYQLQNMIPDMRTILMEERQRLNDVVVMFETRFTGSGQKTSDITYMINLLDELIRYPDDMSIKLSKFSSNISTLSTWTMSLGNQPLLLDYWLIAGDGYKLDKPEGNFIDNLVHNVKAFIGSFTNDYTINTGEVVNKDKTVEVWIATARDQYNIVDRMIREAFVDKPYHVDLKMVNADALLPSTVTNNGPDVAIQISNSMPTNFAFRNAAFDLTTYSDYNEVASWFSPASMEYFEYQGGFYGIPDQMSFPMMFYRKDVFREMGWEVPETWTELVALIPYLQANNMDLFYETTSAVTLGGATSMNSAKAVNSVFLSMLYQQGEDLYRNGGESSNLDNDVTLQTFKNWTEYYTRYGFEVNIDFLTRFRTGDTPIAIVDFAWYNSLMASAPEINGKWGITPIPGTVRCDGTIDRSTASITGASMIIKNSVEKNKTTQEAWEFLKWWGSANTQAAYAKELESILGSAARYPVANIDAISMLNWNRTDLTALLDTVSWLRGIPQVPGGYITGRYVDTSFLKVVNSNAEPVDTLYLTINAINKELENKRKEFGLMSR